MDKYCMYYLFIDLPVPSDLWQVSHALFLHLFRISLFIWRVLTDFWEIRRLHPWSLACNLKINTWKRKFLLETILFRFHVQLREGMFFFCLTNLDFFKQKRVSGKLVWCNFCFSRRKLQICVPIRLQVGLEHIRWEGWHWKESPAMCAMLKYMMVKMGFATYMP